MNTESTERIFFEYEGVKVTNARFVVDGQTFAMSNVTSVKTTEKKPNRLWPSIFILARIVGLFTQPIGGMLVLAIAAFWLFKQRTLYYVVLRTAGAETNALTTDQKPYLDKVAAALNEAIIYRG